MFFHPFPGAVSGRFLDPCVALRLLEVRVDSDLLHAAVLSRFLEQLRVPAWLAELCSSLVSGGASAVSRRRRWIHSWIDTALSLGSD